MREQLPSGGGQFVTALTVFYQANLTKLFQAGVQDTGGC